MNAHATSAAPSFQGQPAAAPIVRRLPDARAVGLRLVRPVRSRARKAPFVVVVLILLSVGLVGLIIMSTVLQAQSFKAAALTREANALETQQQGLTREVEQLQSPSNVARRALIYGMVPNASPAFLRLSDGKVLGKPEAAVRGNNITRVSQ
jgi:cell division protein FtsB